MKPAGSSNSSVPAEVDKDTYRPPTIPTLVQCLQCGEEYESYMIQWQDRVAPSRSGRWCCPTGGCDGTGFGFDILPIDPDYVDEYGNRVWTDEDDEANDIDLLDDTLANESMLDSFDEAADIEAWLFDDDDDEAIPF